jgi:hypothetical protein
MRCAMSMVEHASVRVFAAAERADERNDALSRMPPYRCATGKRGALPPIRAQFRILRRPRRLDRLDRSHHGAAAMVRPRHVCADRDAARARLRARQLRYRGVDPLAQDRLGLPCASEGADGVLRDGARPWRPGRADQSLALAARGCRRLCRFPGLRRCRPAAGGAAVLTQWPAKRRNYQQENVFSRRLRNGTLPMVTLTWTWPSRRYGRRIGRGKVNAPPRHRG